MKEDLELVTEWLLSASEALAPPYFQLPVAGAEEPEYRERVYCYELYHLWRCHWFDGFPFSLSGEIDKQGHPLVRGDAKPDFLVHVPGHMRNLLIVEVKPVTASVTRMADDLKKLTHFRRDLPPRHGMSGDYYAAYFWIYGLSLADWSTCRREILRAMAPRGAFDPALVSCYVHETPGRRAVQVGWQ